MAKQNKVVTLKTATKDKNKPFRTRTFNQQMALALLTIPNAKWQLDDPNYKFDGTELIRKPKSETKS